MIYRIVVTVVLAALIAIALLAASDSQPEVEVPTQQSNPTNFNL
jgi:FlaG/FlaF family flagellin (archaellin)